MKNHRTCKKSIIFQYKIIYDKTKSLQCLSFNPGIIFLSGCVDEKSKFVGTWQFSEDGTVIFNNDGTAVITDIGPLADLAGIKTRISRVDND